MKIETVKVKRKDGTYVICNIEDRDRYEYVEVKSKKKTTSKKPSKNKQPKNSVKEV